jgi:hypothetical protein
MGEVVYLTANGSDNDGNPLLDDPARDPFLSANYPPASRDALKRYGLRSLHFGLFLDLLKMDLSSSRSKLKSASTDDAWHAKLAQSLRSFFAKGNSERKSQLKGLPMLPLWSGEWVAANCGRVYLPSTAGIAIPAGTDLKVVDPAAMVNTDRRGLFFDLGVIEPAISDVRTSIMKGLQSKSCRLDEARSRDHLHYLYHSHPYKQPREDLRGIFLHNHNGLVRRPSHTDFYLPSDHLYGPNSLLAETATAPGLPVSFVHPSYMEDVPSPRDPKQKTWKRWLYEDVGVRERLRLVSRDGTRLSDEWRYVAEHRPDKLLGLLGYLWQHESTEEIEQAIFDEISATDASKMCKGSIPPSSDTCDLEDTWLPLPHLEQQCRHFMEEEEFFPFLDLPDSDSQENFLARWAFLHTFIDVGKDDDTGFLLTILQWIKSANRDAVTIFRPGRLWDLYAAIGAKHLLSLQAGKDGDIQMIR